MPTPKYLPWFFAIFFLFFFQVADAQESESDSTSTADSLAQANADTLQEPFIILDSLHYRFFADGNFTKGNVERSLLILRAEITYDGPVVSLSTNPRFTYGRQNGVLAERETYVDLFMDLFKKRKVYTFGLATIEISNLRAINLRRLAGAGVGWRIWQTDYHRLVLTNAILYESTDFRERETIDALRNSARLKGSHAFLQDRIRLTHLSFVQPALNDISNVRWSTLISLELPLNKWISIRSSFENTYESKVQAGRKRNDSRLAIGFSVGNKQL